MVFSWSLPTVTWQISLVIIEAFIIGSIYNNTNSNSTINRRRNASKSIFTFEVILNLTYDTEMVRFYVIKCQMSYVTGKRYKLTD